MGTAGTDANSVPTVSWTRLSSASSEARLLRKPLELWHPAQRALIQPIQLMLSLSHNIFNEWDSQVTARYQGISLRSSVSDGMQSLGY